LSLDDPNLPVGNVRFLVMKLGRHDSAAIPASSVSFGLVRIDECAGHDTY